MTSTSHRLKVLAPRVISLKPIAVMKKSQMKKYHIGNKKVLEGTFDNLKKIKVNKIPFDIDRKKVSQVTAHTIAKLLEKLEDGRQWKKGSRTTWSDFKDIRYRDCYGGYTCPNVDCNHLLQFGKPNKVNFEKDGTCKTCWATGKKIHVFRIRTCRTLLFS